MAYFEGRDELDLGDNHRLVFFGYKGEDRAGCGVVHHIGKTGETCTGLIPFEGRSWAQAFNNTITAWKVEQDEPITLSPSILCKACGDHGFIREGKWVRA